MKKYLIPFLTILMLFLFNNCTSEKKEKQEKENLESAVDQFDSTDLKTSAISDNIEDKSFFLKYIFNEGKSFSYRLTTLAHTETNLQADTSIINISDQKIIRIADFKIESVENDSIADIKCTVSNIFLDAKLNNETHTYRSGSVLDSNDQKNYLEYEGLINNPFNIRITKFGELLEIYKVNKIIDRYLDLSGFKDSVHTEDKDVFKDQIINNLLKPFISQIFREIPSYKLEVESTWEKNPPPLQLMVFKIQNTNHFKILKLEMYGDDRVAVIDGSVTSLIEGKTKATNNGINYEFTKPVTEAAGKIYFNINKGMVLKSKTRNKISLSYTMQMLTPQGYKTGISKESMTTDNILELL